MTWDTPWRASLSALWRFIGPSSFDNNSSNPILAGSEEGGYDAANARIPGYSYLDLTATGHVTDTIDVRVGVTNVFDKDPPIFSTEIVNGQQSNSFPAYDVVGRQLFASVSAKF
jgi:outer membrane receptor for ferrienterochelin and colicin